MAKTKTINRTPWEISGCTEKEYRNWLEQMKNAPAVKIKGEIK